MSPRFHSAFMNLVESEHLEFHLLKVRAMFEQAKSPKPDSSSNLKSLNNNENNSKGSVISSDLIITGSVDAEGSITVEGKIHGDVNCKSVLVQESGIVEGSVTAEDINIFGTVDGTITGKKVSIRATSKVEADIHHELIELEMGTEFSGVLKRSDSENNRPSLGENQAEVYSLSEQDTTS